MCNHVEMCGAGLWALWRGMDEYLLCTVQRIPYLGPIYGGLREGMSIYIQGSIPEDINRCVRVYCCARVWSQLLYQWFYSLYDKRLFPVHKWPLIIIRARLGIWPLNTSVVVDYSVVTLKRFRLSFSVCSMISWPSHSLHWPSLSIAWCEEELF